MVFEAGIRCICQAQKKKKKKISILDKNSWEIQKYYKAKFVFIPIILIETWAWKKEMF